MFSSTNSLHDVGFLSPEIGPITDDLRRIHANWFVLAEDVNRTAHRILREFEPGDYIPVRDIVAVALLMRTLSNFQGAILMAERGMVVEAGTLARCCFENAIFVGVLRREGDAFLTEMQMSHRVSDKTMARWLVRVPDRLEHAPRGAKQKLEGVINYIRQQIPGFTRPDFAKLAERAGIADTYIHYAILSRDAAHPSAQSIDRYLIRGRDDFPLQGMRWGAYAYDPDELGLRLNMAIVAVLLVCETLCEMLPNAEALSEVQAHLAAHNRLNGGKL